MLHALLVEDDDRHTELVFDALRGVAAVQRAHTADEALAALAWVVPDVVLADVRGTTSASPLELAVSLRIALDTAGARVRTRHPIPLILVSALDPDVLATVAGSLVRTHALPKPFLASTLRSLVELLTGDTAHDP